jgi:uncharacterized protein YecE (DUF72 family)
VAIGTAGWSIPKQQAAHFPHEGSHLERYARRFNAVEINSSFYRSHRRATYERWAAAVPDGFRFAVKVPKVITHERRLANAGDLVDSFFFEGGGLGSKLGPLLVQLPPSLMFREGVADVFIRDLRQRCAGEIAAEPRHVSWFTPEVGRLLADLQVSRVAADPAPVAGAGEPGGWSGLRYYRLHGSPKMYYSPYTPEALDRYVAQLAAQRARGAEVWCIFDNTAAFAATADALAMIDRLR